MTGSKVDLFRLDKSHVKPAADMLTRAFWNYPVSTYAYSDELLREKRLPYFFQHILYYCIRYGEVYGISSSIEGIAAWLPSDHFQMTALKLLRSVPLSVFFHMGHEGGMQMKSFSDHIDGVHRRMAPFRHWFLQVLGIDPPHQGKGYASALVRPLLARLDHEKLPCYLETIDPRDVTIYEHFGFQVVDASNVPGIGLTSWAMLRTTE